MPSPRPSWASQKGVNNIEVTMPKKPQKETSSAAKYALIGPVNLPSITLTPTPTHTPEPTATPTPLG